MVVAADGTMGISYCLINTNSTDGKTGKGVWSGKRQFALPGLAKAAGFRAGSPVDSGDQVPAIDKGPRHYTWDLL